MFETELCDRFVAESVAARGSTLFWGSKASLPVKGKGAKTFLHVVVYGGQAPLKVHNTGAAPALQRPRAQVVAHGEEPAAAWALAQAAYTACFVANTRLSEVWYPCLSALQDPFDMGLDESGRLKVGFNVEALKAVS